MELPPATHGGTGVDSTNRWRYEPVSGTAAYRLHVKVDDRPVRTQGYGGTVGAGNCLRAVLWLDRHDGAFAFDEIDCGDRTA